MKFSAKVRARAVGRVLVRRHEIDAGERDGVTTAVQAGLGTRALSPRNKALCDGRQAHKALQFPDWTTHPV